MKPLLALLAVAVLVAPAAAEDVEQDLGPHFQGFRSALVLRDVTSGRTVRHNPPLPPGPGIVYRGKTGSCQDPGAKDPHGWWVGSVEKEGRLFLYAALIEGPGASGPVCRPMAEKALAALGVLPAR